MTLRMAAVAGGFGFFLDEMYENHRKYRTNNFPFDNLAA